MSVEEFLVQQLEPFVGQRVYRQQLPIDAQLPARTYTRISAPHTYTHDGDDGLVKARFQIDNWADDADAADDVADDMIERLSGYSDPIIQSVMVADDRELHEPEVGVYRRSIDIEVAYQEESGS